MSQKTRFRWWGAAGVALLVVGGCGPTPPAPPVEPAPPLRDPGETAAPLAVHWVRAAAEHRVVFEQVYRWVGERVAEAVSGGSEPWAVILDADETVLDNSTYQLRRARQGLGFTPESWNDWVREEAAPSLPGAVAFVTRVKSLGGHVAIVTNRDETVCGSTRRNLTAVGVEADVVLCRQPGVSEKETRFRQVQEGMTPVGLPPLRVVAWVGDNIRDFPGGTQELRGADPGRLSDFGTRFFVVPNPMYGSWTSNSGG